MAVKEEVARLISWAQCGRLEKCAGAGGQDEHGGGRHKAQEPPAFENLKIWDLERKFKIRSITHRSVAIIAGN